MMYERKVSWAESIYETMSSDCINSIASRLDLDQCEIWVHFEDIDFLSLSYTPSDEVMRRISYHDGFIIVLRRIMM